MKKSQASVFVLLFVFVFVFAMTVAISAAGGDPDPQYMCCTYIDACDHTGYGAWFTLPGGGPSVCRCYPPGGGQGWIGNCFFACPANCIIP